MSDISNPNVPDVGQRSIEVATRNDIRQYGQSAMGALYLTASGHNQGQLFTEMAIHPRTPFDQASATGRQEIENAVEAFVTGSPVDPMQMSFDLYGTQAGADIGGSFDTSY